MAGFTGFGKSAVSTVNNASQRSSVPRTYGTRGLTMATYTREPPSVAWIR